MQETTRTDTERRLAELESALARGRAEFDKVVSMLKLANARAYGAKSEKVRPRQLSLLNDMEAAREPEAHEPAPEEVAAQAISMIDRMFAVDNELDGNLPIDNNRAEQAICPFAIGRKNWLFSDTQAGAEASCGVYSIVTTARPRRGGWLDCPRSLRGASRQGVGQFYHLRSTDPRNEAMMRVFAMVEIGERAGSGMDKIFEGWKWAGYDAPSYEVAFGPDRTTLTLPLTYASGASADEGPSKTVEDRRRRLNGCAKSRSRIPWLKRAFADGRGRRRHRDGDVSDERAAMPARRPWLCGRERGDERTAVPGGEVGTP